MFVSVYIHMCIYEYVDMYVRMYIQIRGCVSFTYKLCTYECTYTCIHTYTCICVPVKMWTSTYKRTYVPVCTRAASSIRTSIRRYICTVVAESYVKIFNMADIRIF